MNDKTVEETKDTQDFWNSDITPHRFEGRWKITAWTSRSLHPRIPPVYVRIRYDSTCEHFKLDYIEKEPQAGSNESDSESHPDFCLEYQKNSGVLVSIACPQKRICISFWRQHGEDKIVALNLNGEDLWSARRVNPNAEPPDLERICKTWEIVDELGVNRRNYVELKRLVAVPNPGPGGYPTQTGCTDDVGLLGLFAKDRVDGDGRLYDILYFDARDRSFNSVFGVRTVHFWLQEDDKDRIFATFYRSFRLPTTSFGAPGTESRLGQLMSCEKAATKEPELFTDPNDPGSGCWRGEPPP